MDDSLIVILILIILGLVVLKYIWPQIKPKPKRSKIEEILEPYAMLAVSLAYSTAQKYYESNTPLKGEAKKAAAMWLYDRLPDEIDGYNIHILKESGLISEEIFSNLIEQVYRQSETWCLTYLGNEKGDWSVKNE